mgnify:CR=1 FL=1
MTDINRHFGTGLASILAPRVLSRAGGSSSDAHIPGADMIAFRPLDLLGTTFAHPAYKLAHLCVGVEPARKAAIFDTDSWTKLARRAARALPKYDVNGCPGLTLAASVYARGVPGKSWVKGSKRALAALGGWYQPVAWNPYCFDALASVESIVRPARPNLAVLWNHTNLGSELQRTIDAAALMYEAGAYLHWYRKFDCPDQVLESAFEVVQGMRDAYVYAGEPS